MDKKVKRIWELREGNKHDENIFCEKIIFNKNRLLENDKLLEASYTNNTENFDRFSSC